MDAILTVKESSRFGLKLVCVRDSSRTVLCTESGFPNRAPVADTGTSSLSIDVPSSVLHSSKFFMD